MKLGQRILKIGGISLVVIYLLVCLVMKLMEDSFVYHPNFTTRKVDQTVPTKLGLDVDEVKVNTRDGQTLSGWVVYPDPLRSTGQWVIFLHGNAGNVSDMNHPRRYAALSKMGLGVIAFDYRGFGASTGEPSEQGLYLDAQAVYDYARKTRKLASDQLIIYGYSLGTGVATDLASHNHASGLILEAPYMSVPAVGAEDYPWIPVKLLMRNEFNSLEKIPTVNYPLLVLHAQDDKQIPFAHGEAILNAAKAAKTLVPLRGGHIEACIIDSARFYGAIESFASGVK